MASGKPPLEVSLSTAADDDLWGIWGDNLEKYKDVDHADGYLAFLRTGINRLSTRYGEGKPLDGFPEFLYITLEKGHHGHGHYVIYKIDEAQQRVKVLRVFHTRMDVRGRLERE